MPHCHSIIGAGDWDSAASEVGAIAAQVEDKIHVRLRGSREYWFADCCLTDDSDHVFALRVAEADEFSLAAVGVKARYPLAGNPTDNPAKLLFVDPSLSIVRDDVGNENA